MLESLSHFSSTVTGIIAPVSAVKDEETWLWARWLTCILSLNIFSSDGQFQIAIWFKSRLYTLDDSIWAIKIRLKPFAIRLATRFKNLAIRFELQSNANFLITIQQHINEQACLCFQQFITSFFIVCVKWNHVALGFSASHHQATVFYLWCYYLESTTDCANRRRTTALAIWHGEQCLAC